MKKWTVTFVDYGETCDGKARTLKICDSKEEAQALARNDMKAWSDKYAGEDINVNFDTMSACFNDDTGRGCEWNVEEIDVNITASEKISQAKQILIDNGVDADEAGSVLQDIGYAWLDVELGD